MPIHAVCTAAILKRLNPASRQLTPKNMKHDTSSQTISGDNSLKGSHLFHEEQPAQAILQKEYLIALFCAAVLAFFFLLYSPLHPWRYAPTTADSGVFKTVAMMMNEGFMPYKDSFDHKGPVLYILNWIGMQISYYKGTWAIEFIFMTVSFFLLYCIARLSASILPAVLAVFISSSLLFPYFYWGNVTEEYALPCIAMSLYFFLDFCLHRKCSSFRILLSGMAFAFVCLLRPNMAAVWIVFCPVILWMAIQEKNWKLLGQFVSFFIAGICVIAVPILLWLYANDALSQCFADYIIFNGHYCENGQSNLQKQLSSFVHFASSPVYLFATAGCLLCLRKNCFLLATYFVLMLLAVLLICLSGMRYGHYGMVLIPIACYPISLFLGTICERVALLSQNTGRITKLSVCVLACAWFIWSAMPFIQKLPAWYTQFHTKKINPAVQNIVGKVRSLTKDTDRISVYGNWDIIYVLSKRMHATRYSYQFPVSNILPSIRDEYMAGLKRELPKVIVVQEKHYDSSIQKFLTQNGYSRVWPENTAEMDMARTGQVFYRQ